MDQIVVGLVPSPGLPEKIPFKIIDELSTNIKKGTNWELNLKFEIKTDPIIGSSEQINKAMNIANRVKKENNWDYIICLTDLPRFSKKKAIVSDVNINQRVAIIFLPTLGAINIQTKTRYVITDVLNYLLLNNTQYKIKQPKRTRMQLNLFSKIKMINPEEETNINRRFIMNSSVIGAVHTIIGMTYLNQPWKAITSFTKILSLSFATGTYISIFPTPWQLSAHFSLLRFTMLALISIIGMVFWLIYTHNLWEPKSSKNKRKYRFIYNITTFITLLVITIANYLILYTLLTLMVSFFIPETLFTTWGQASPEHSVINYMRLSWFITSLGIIVGAFGSSTQREKEIRKVTYSYRQLNRYNRDKSQKRNKI
ncbi:uncharacterized membrane protein YidH (DUF202 family) [Staphylococcus saprophyticus]|uniref:hypothetical protein n=1 Tax=Staphylococcus TaxID=1279 RepID=UPI0007D92642|nr:MULTISPECIES: hypothetical protein [Staphylococcus]MBU8681469.1 hypothetical protein [Staphylococcus saprophyticus]MDW3983252.1 hypothetical protein [Staphylococcus saprophyticus]MDW4018456.1 hypothetical protein [Staphylococcus saprophyticus]OAO11492.1 hypothetical protein A4A82_01195 [Staphylococcus cohnii]WQL49289.1 hypothetical protein P3U29_13015 [Staphylococcus saprophyticus]